MSTTTSPTRSRSSARCSTATSTPDVEELSAECARPYSALRTQHSALKQRIHGIARASGAFFLPQGEPRMRRLSRIALALAASATAALGQPSKLSETVNVHVVE